MNEMIGVALDTYIGAPRGQCAREPVRWVIRQLNPGLSYISLGGKR
jgi:hypothetical protein